MNSPNISVPQRGFTLIEMLVSMVVLAVILTMAVPALSGFVRSSKVRAAQSELIASFMLARSEAAKRGIPVSLVASAPVASNEFGGGWTVWLDANSDGVVDTGEEVIRRLPDLGGSVTVAANDGTNNVTLVRYAPSGFLTAAGPISFKVCGSGAPTGFAVALQLVGLADLNDQATCP